jgi:hypothetical protein
MPEELKILARQVREKKLREKGARAVSLLEAKPRLYHTYISTNDLPNAVMLHVMSFWGYPYPANGFLDVLIEKGVR